MKNVGIAVLACILLVACAQTGIQKSLVEDEGSPQKVALLRERVKELWSSFVAEDYEKVYPLQDPFFRGKVKKYAYLAGLGKVKYHSFEIGDIKVQGNVASVGMTVVYSVPPVKVKKQELSQPETTTNFTETWLYMDGNWYREFYSEMTESGFIQY